MMKETMRITVLDQNLINKKEELTAQEEKVVHGQMYPQSSAKGTELGSQISKCP